MVLSQWYVKFIVELVWVCDEEQLENQFEKNLGDSVIEWLNCFNSFVQVVEQVVFEYEKMIQFLEQLLVSIRVILFSIEGFLLEKEFNCVYVEMINNQFQVWLQKFMDCEVNIESYLYDLEIKLDGYMLGEEKNIVIIMELCKEIVWVCENEVVCENYILILEECFVEVDQDVELMQCEIDRLEQVVEW